MGAGGNSIMGFFGFLLMGIFTMSFGFMFRKRVIMFDTVTNQITEEFIKRPRFGTIRSEMKVPISVDIVKNTRVVHHSDDDGGGWTTTHRGIDIMVDLVGQGPKAVLFLEGKNPQTEFESILELLFSTLGIKDEEEGQKWWESDDQS
jgi:hypothetical protein